MFHRREVVRLIVENIDNNKKTNIDILKAMRIADKAWGNVCEATIKIV